MTESASRLPAEFVDLEPFSHWAIQGERNRYQKRLASTMDDLQAFYDAVLPRLADVCAHLDAIAVDDLDEQGRNLLWMACSFVNVSFPVEVWRQQRVPDSGAADIYAVVEPAI